MARTPKRDSSRRERAVRSVKYPATRKNIPPAGLEAHGMVRDEAAVRYEYNAHLPPVLRSAPDGAADRVRELLAAARQRALTEEEADALAEAVRQHEPWLEWSGKREKQWFEVDPVPLHMHERVSTQAILRVLAREDVNRDLFADPQQDYAQAVQFYRHDVDWANRMILGDSLQVMASLARREDLAGKVQMIYFDPPYGISFSSNFQPDIGRRKVEDIRQDFARQPEVVEAYRDTWVRGIHSYLAYLRDRLTMARELLADTGSIFVQISDKNLHRVRCVMDEVFGEANAVVTIVFKKKGATTPTSAVHDYLLWYAKDRAQTKIIPLAEARSDPEDDPKFRSLISPDGEVRRAGRDANERASLLSQGYRWARVDYPIVSQDPQEARSADYVFQGRSRSCGPTRHWSFDVPTGLDRLAKAERLFSGGGDSIGGVFYWQDRGSTAISNLWVDTKGEANPIYAVQTAWKVVQRCLLMTTDPGDLVLDPTCGSGTTAFVAEQWARRWIAIDTSRVALALAKHRLMTARFDYYALRELRDEDRLRNPRGTWIADENGRKPLTLQCKEVPRITLNGIAHNVSLDPIFAKHEPLLADALAALNAEAAKLTDKLRAALVDKLVAKHMRDGASAVTDADVRRWLLPGADGKRINQTPARGGLKGVTANQAARYRERIPSSAWQEWQAPFDTDPDWPAPLREALLAYRSAWRNKLAEVDDCIAANAESDELVDSPNVVSGMVRVAGPFTMEGVIAVEDGPDTPIGGAPETLEVFDAPDSVLQVANAEAHLAKVIRYMCIAGVDFPGNRSLKFARLDATTGSLIHAEGEWANGADGGDENHRVAVSIGPAGGNLSAFQVEEAIRDANRAGYDDVVFAAFGFDAAAQEAIEEASHPKLHLHMALIRPDVKMDDDLLKAKPTNQLFTVFSAPRVTGPQQQEDGQYVVEVEGMDVYDPGTGAISPTNSDEIAAWFLDTDYDGRTFCVCQAFFPDRSKWERLARVLGENGAVEPGAFDALSGLASLPFTRPARLMESDAWRIAVKVIDPRGNEGLRVRAVE